MSPPLRLMIISPSIAWRALLQEIAYEFGIMAYSSVDLSVTGDYDLIFIDGSLIPKVVTALKVLRKRYLKAYIVVFAVSPTWQDVRDILLGGASTYLTKSVSREDNRAMFRRLLDQLPNNSARIGKTL